MPVTKLQSAFTVFRRKFTCGIYPTILPGTPWPNVPGFSPRAKILPLSILSLPNIHLSNVVFPQPLGPKRP